MILSCYFSKERNAMGDLYLNMMNSMPNKNKIALIIPYAYNEDEFSNEFFAKFRETVSSVDNKFLRIILLKRFIWLIKKYFSGNSVSKVYFQIDQFIYNWMIIKIFSNIKYSVWLHDPVLHEGVSTAERIYRCLSYKTYFNKIDNFIISYNGAKELDRVDKRLCSIRDRFVVSPLPQMPEMEFDEIKNKINEIKYDYIFFGRIELYKGLDFLVDVMSDDRLKSSKLLIVGTGRDAGRVESIVNKKDNIHFINRYVSNYELAELICASKCVVLPYISATGSQTVSIANYYSRLVIASNVGCFTEYIIDGQNGFIFKVKDKESLVEKLLLVLNTDLEAYKCGIEKIYNKYDITKISNSVFEIINK